MINHTFDKLYNKLISQQKTIFSSSIISEGWLDSLKEVGNIVGGVGEALVSIPKGDIKGVGKGLWKTVSAPIGAVTELGKPSIDDLKAEYQKVQKADFEADGPLKTALEKGTKDISDDDIISEFTNWSEAGKQFVEFLKGELKEEDKVKKALRKILAFRINEKAIRESEEKIKAAKEKNKELDEKAEKEENEEGQEEKDPADFSFFRNAIIEIYGQKKAELFDKKLKEGKVLMPNPSSKFFAKPVEQVEKNMDKWKERVNKNKPKAIENFKKKQGQLADAKKKNLDDAGATSETSPQNKRAAIKEAVAKDPSKFVDADFKNVKLKTYITKLNKYFNDKKREKYKNYYNKKALEIIDNLDPKDPDFVTLEKLA